MQNFLMNMGLDKISNFDLQDYLSENDRFKDDDNKLFSWDYDFSDRSYPSYPGEAFSGVDIHNTMEKDRESEVYYFWTDSETNTHGVTVANSEGDDFSVIEEFTFDAISAITAPEDEGGNGEGAAWGDAIVSDDGSRLFVNARNADKVVVIDTETYEVETILDVGDRAVHSFSYNGELWVHVDGDGGFNVIDQETLEVSELIEANTVGTGHGKLLLAEGLGTQTYVTNTAEPAVFPIDLETREVGAPIEIGGGDPELGTHDKGYDPATGLAFFQLTDDAGFSFIDAETNEVVYDLVPITGRIAHTPDDEYIIILDAEAESDDIGIWNTTLDTHTQPEFDATVTIGGGVSVNGTEFDRDGEDWEAWIPQTEGDNVAVLNLTTNEVEYIEVGDLTVPEGARHFSRIGDIDEEHFFTYSDEGGVKIDLDTLEVSDSIDIGGQVSRMAVVDTTSEMTVEYDYDGYPSEKDYSFDFSVFESDQGGRIDRASAALRDRNYAMETLFESFDRSYEGAIEVFGDLTMFADEMEAFVTASSGEIGS